MSKAVSSSNLEIEKAIEFESLLEDLNHLQVEDFVWIDTAPPETMPEGEIVTCTSDTSDVVIIAQYSNDKESEDNQYDETAEEYLTSDLDVSDEEFWDEEHYDIIPKMNAKSKQFNSQKLKPIEHFNTFRKTTSKDKEERRSHSQYMLDNSTIMTIGKLLDIRSFSPYHNVVGKGSNSVVINTGTSYFTRCHISHCTNAIKIYKLTDNEVTNKAIFERTEREYQNLFFLRYFYYRDIRTFVPCIVKYAQNVIVMQYIDKQTAPSITTHPPHQSLYLYNRITEHMRVWHRLWDWRPGVVHGNLSTKTILYKDNEPFYIGWGHSVQSEHPQALAKMMKDCCFVTRFFKKRVPEKVRLPSPLELFKKITKVHEVEITRDVWDVLNKKVPRKKPLRSNPNRKSN